MLTQAKVESLDPLDSSSHYKGNRQCKGAFDPNVQKNWVGTPIQLPLLLSAVASPSGTSWALVGPYLISVHEDGSWVSS